MDIKIAEICGLCAGCKKAIQTAQQLLQSGKQVTIFKEIVHNKNVNSMLRNLGANFEEDIDMLKPCDVVIIRAHGETPETYKHLEKNNIEYRDCTCFNVENIHKQVANFSSQGYAIVIIGKHKDKIHPEVLGTQGWANNQAVIVQDESDLKQIEDIKKDIYLVCQTTFNINKADVLIDKIQKVANKKGLRLIVNKSICSANSMINKCAKELAQKSDVMIVVGGKNSSNTKELYENVKTICPTIFIEYINDYKQEMKKNNIRLTEKTKIGITAGASTMKEELENLKQLILTDNKEV